MCVKLGEVIVDATNISQAELEKLKSLLPDIQKAGNTSQLEIILEAIQYIKNLQGKLMSWIHLTLLIDITMNDRILLHLRIHSVLLLALQKK